MEKVWVFLDVWDSVRHSTASSQFQSSVGRMASSFSSCYKENRRRYLSVRLSVRFLFFADVLKKCALFALESSEAWSEGESVSSIALRESNACNDALHVIGLHGSGDKIFFFFLQELGVSKGGVELPLVPGHAVPGNIRDKRMVWVLSRLVEFFLFQFLL